MVDLKALQQIVFQNKLDKGFNVTDINLELCFMQSELTEIFQATFLGRGDVGEELADVAIYLLGLAQILDVDLEKEILAKIERNAKRRYERRDGVVVRIED